MIWLTHLNAFDGFDFMNDLMDYKELISQKIIGENRETDINEKFLIINTSKNNQLFNEGRYLNSVIVDRTEISRVLGILDENSDNIKFIILDVFLIEPDGQTDFKLQGVLDNLNKKNKIVIPYYFDDRKNVISPYFDSKNGLSQYRSSFLNYQFLKYSFITDDAHKQIPLIAYEAVTKKNMEKRRFCGMPFLPFYTIGNRWCLNTVIPAFFYTSADLIEGKTFFHLGCFKESDIGKDQIVMIGDFEGARDVHHSIIDRVSGSLILLNAFELLRREINIIKFPYLLLLFFMFTLISYHTFYKNMISAFYKEINRRSATGNFIRKNLNYIIIFLLSLISMLIFYIYIHLFILLGYFAFIDIINLLIKTKNSRHEKFQGQK